LLSYLSPGVLFPKKESGGSDDEDEDDDDDESSEDSEDEEPPPKRRCDLRKLLRRMINLSELKMELGL
jgi:hypothetical protein